MVIAIGCEKETRRSYKYRTALQL